MIAVFDFKISERAHTVRNIILLKGYPCVAADAKTIENYNPVRLLVTFADQLDNIRRTPYDDIQVIVYGGGFVNSALNAVKAERLDDIFSYINSYIVNLYSIRRERIFPGDGVFVYPGVYLSWDSLVVYGSRINLTALELMIVKCLILSGRHYRTVSQLYHYCFPKITGGKSEIESIRVHIFNINKKSVDKISRKLIESRKNYGYRFACVSAFYDKISHKS